MPTKRFHKLDADKQRHILHVAAEEFAAHGFEAASYNRIIAASGVSKGAMYYYFEDKADLYATVVGRLSVDMLEGIGSFEPVATPEAFWAQVTEMCMGALIHSMHDPVALGLFKNMAKDAHTPTGHELLENMRVQMKAWLGDLLHTGQACGAIRTDLPDSMLIALALGLGEAHDIWVAEHLDEIDPTTLPEMLPKTVDLFRRLFAP